MTDTSGKTSGTATRAISEQYKECGRYSGGSGKADTQNFARDNTPGMYKRRITATAGKTPSVFSVVYDHKRAQRELAFIRANRALEEQRNG